MPKNRFTPPTGQMKAKERQFEKMQTTGRNPHTGETMTIWVAVPKANKGLALQAYEQENDCADACDHLNESTPAPP